MKIKCLVVVITLCLVTGCTSMVHRGVVAMKVSDTKAHVCVDRNEIGTGDTVKIYRSVCTSTPAQKGPGTSCKKELVGTGTVTGALNEHYSEVSVPAGTEFREGDLVER